MTKMIAKLREVKKGKLTKEENAIKQVSDCIKAWENNEPATISTETMKTVLKTLKEVKDFRDVGNVKTMKELKKLSLKRQPKSLNKKYCDYKVDDEEIHSFYATCPNCEQTLNFYWHQKYCGNCGQALIWRNLKSVISKKDLDKILN